MKFKKGDFPTSEKHARTAFSLPIYYEGINIEHKHVRESVGLFDVSHMGQLIIEGNNACDFLQKLITNDVKMFSDGFIEVNNLNGDFLLKGTNSKLVNENIIIKAETINGNFTEKANEKEITYLEVIDKNISYVKNNDTEMYAKKINFDYDTSIIELIDDVIIIRNEEKITGDYGTLDTKNNSYKIKSNNQNRVKVIIQNNE